MTIVFSCIGMNTTIGCKGIFLFYELYALTSVLDVPSELTHYYLIFQTSIDLNASIFIPDTVF